MVYKKRLLNRAVDWKMLDKVLILKGKIFYKYRRLNRLQGGVAQVVRACGSYPQCPEFESLHRHHL